MEDSFQVSQSEMSSNIGPVKQQRRVRGPYKKNKVKTLHEEFKFQHLPTSKNFVAKLERLQKRLQSSQPKLLRQIVDV